MGKFKILQKLVKGYIVFFIDNTKRFNNVQNVRQVPENHNISLKAQSMQRASICLF